MSKNPNQVGWYFNENNCIACRTCEAGYALWHGKLADIIAQETPPKIYQQPLKEVLPGFADPGLTRPSVMFSENT